MRDLRDFSKFRRLLPILAMVLASGLVPSVGQAQTKPVRSTDLLLEQPKTAYKSRRQALIDRIAQEEKPAKAKVEAAGKAEATEKGETVAKSPEVLVVVVGETDEPEDARFRQNNWFAYLTGVDVPHASMILRVGAKEETLFLPSRNAMMERWTGPKIGPGPEGVEATGFAKVEPSANFNSTLFRLLDEKGKGETGGSAGTVYLISSGSRGGDASETAKLTEVIRKRVPSAKIKGLSGPLGSLRMVKDEGEVRLLRKAIAITGEAQAGVVRAIAPGVPEYKLEGIILGEFIGGGGMRAGFPSIVGSGLNSTVLHYNANRKTLEPGDLVVVDIGAEYFYYTADITRTYPASGKFTPRQREIYQLVLDAQEHGEKTFEPGKTSLMSMHQSVVEFLHKSPLRAKDEKGKEQSMDRFFIHGLGHSLGMDVHDVMGQGRGSLPTGAVFTIEPGIYIPAEGFGVRIEDDYLVTKEGLDKLSKDIPVKPDDIEALIAKGRASAKAKASPKVE